MTRDRRQRARIGVRGAVQGVGFRPFVFRLASSLELTGWVNNSSQGVWIEVEGPEERVRRFVRQLEREQPPRAFIQSLEASYLDPAGYDRFEIRPSSAEGEETRALVLPDIATCAECLAEVFDPADRRYRYPFTNCTNCGPRFSIVESLPYDRPNTTMRGFAMCEACRAEYEDPRDRRFHAQPNACPACGPHLELWRPDGSVVAAGDEALLLAAREVQRGRILAAKGLGGFHLIVHAGCDDAVRDLRQRKSREEKPFAVMAPSLDAAVGLTEVSELEARLLASPEAPIVLLRVRDRARTAMAPSVAPGNPNLGVMLPYTPLHHLLLRAIGAPIVATSGNRSDEPICTDERDALVRLGGLADLFLVHDRPIARHVDDSIARVAVGRELVLRRARGYAPLPVRLERPAPPLLAVGAHLKNAVAVTAGDNVFISQHVGDLETPQAYAAFEEVIGSLRRLYRVEPAAVGCDGHPAYLSTAYARRSGLAVVAVQHHHAHVLSAMAENALEGPVLGVSWDGTGYGPDETVWGGEFLAVGERGFERFAHLRTFPLPGGEKAVKEPRRSALGLLHELFGPRLAEQPRLAPLEAFTPADLRVMTRMLDSRINAPRTSSAGRLFDAVASLAGLRQVMRFEGQAAMELEFLLSGLDTAEGYPFSIRVSAATGPSPEEAGASAQVAGASGPLVVDWEPAIRAILEDVWGRTPAALISARFHNTLVRMVLDVARRAGLERVVLSGGCFQNACLLERTVALLEREGFRPYWHQRVPPNDGGIALGQIVAAIRALDGERTR